MAGQKKEFYEQSERMCGRRQKKRKEHVRPAKNCKISKNKFVATWYAMCLHQMQFKAHKQGRNRINYHMENCRNGTFSLCCSCPHAPWPRTYHYTHSHELKQIHSIQMRYCANKTATETDRQTHASRARVTKWQQKLFSWDRNGEWEMEPIKKLLQSLRDENEDCEKK